MKNLIGGFRQASPLPIPWCAMLEGRTRGFNALRETWIEWVDWAEPEPQPEPWFSEDLPHESLTKQSMAGRLAGTGLFDLAFYNRSYGLNLADEQKGLDHYFHHGAAEGKRPNLYFDPAGYLERYPDVRAAGIDALFHYLVQGESEGRRPGPLFDGLWYRDTYKVPAEENALAHFLAHRNSGIVSPIPDFDVEHYLRENVDVKDAGVDSFEHYISWGYREGRNPSPAFNTHYYISRYLKGVENVHPFFHYLQHKLERGVSACPQAEDLAIPRALKTYTKSAAEFEDFAPLLACAPRKAKVLAYYLPQFHPFPENNEWWGTGFTEWTNVARGMSRFKGHYQPRIPRDLGFYSLDDPQTLKRQVEMAKAGGIYGFVYYHYYFNAND